MKTALITLTFSLTVAAPAWADGDTVLRHAFEQAWVRHPQAAALEAREAEAAARHEQTQALTPGPASVSVGHLNDALASNRGKREWEVELAAPLWLPRQKAARQAEAAQSREAMAARRAVTRLQLAGEVREAWWNLARSRHALDLARRRVESAQALEATVTRRYQAGDLSRIDANLARSERLAAEADLAEVQSDGLRATQSWQALTGLPAPESLPAETAATAPEAHPELASATAATQLFQTALRVAEAQQREAPELALRVVRDRGDAAEAYANAIGIRLTVPFSQPARVRHEHAGARAALAEAEAEQAQRRQRLALAQEAARATLARTEQQGQGARERLTLAEDNLQLAEKAFTLGESDLASLLRARAAAFEAASLRNRLEVARAAAQSALNQSLGVLP